jgi:CBS domain containing-hemolysin-like protein
LIWISLIALLVLTLFATLNLSLQGVSRSRLGEQLERLHRSEKTDDYWARRTHHLLATAFIRAAATLAFTVATLFGFGAFIDSAGPWRLVGGCALVLLMILIFGAAVPHACAKYAGAIIVVRFHTVLAAVRIICYPALIALDIVDPLVRRLADAPAPDSKTVADELEQEILSAVTEGEMHGAVDEEEKEMIESVIELGDKRVEQIMTPRTDVVALPRDAGLDEVLAVIRRNGHSRIPVFDETIDTILGILYAKDLLLRDEHQPFDATRIARKALFVPESKLVRELLREFRETKVHFAVVLDEYGGTAGIATIEDILEELVGEIADEYDTSGVVELKRIDAETVEVDARMRIDELNERLHTRLPEDADYETIGGYVFNTLGKIPRVGEVCESDHIGIQVIGAEPQRITRLRLRLPQKEASIKHEASRD